MKHRHIYHQTEPLVYSKSHFNCDYCGKHSADCNCHQHQNKKTGDKKK